MLFLMDENSCIQCFCTEKYEKCVRPGKDLSLKAALQGRENKIKRLLCRNQATMGWVAGPYLKGLAPHLHRDITLPYSSL